jgi:hypothetical protein
MPTTSEKPAAAGTTETVGSPFSVGTPTKKVVGNRTSKPATEVTNSRKRPAIAGSTAVAKTIQKSQTSATERRLQQQQKGRKQQQ